MEALLTVRDLMRILKCSRSTIIRLEKAGKIEAVSFTERKKLYRPEDIKKLIDMGVKE